MAALSHGAIVLCFIAAPERAQLAPATATQAVGPSNVDPRMIVMVVGWWTGLLVRRPLSLICYQLKSAPPFAIFVELYSMGYRLQLTVHGPL